MQFLISSTKEYNQIEITESIISNIINKKTSKPFSVKSGAVWKLRTLWTVASIMEEVSTLLLHGDESIKLLRIITIYGPTTDLYTLLTLEKFKFNSWRPVRLRRINLAQCDTAHTIVQGAKRQPVITCPLHRSFIISFCRQCSRKFPEWKKCLPSRTKLYELHRL